MRGEVRRGAPSRGTAGGARILAMTAVADLAAAGRLAAGMIDQLAALVARESPSSDGAALAACAELTGRLGHDAFGYPPRRVQVGGRTHLLWRRPAASVLLLGHYDTVWPVGTLAGWP